MNLLIIYIIFLFNFEKKDQNITFLYYSGHGASFGGQNYLLPTDADISCLEQIEAQGIGLNRILGEIAAKEVKTSFVVLDACRNIPKQLYVCDNSKKDLFTNKGLLKPSNNPRGSLIIFATEEGNTADDNLNANNGLFTESLLRYLTLPDLSIRNIMDKAAINVEEQSMGKQSPSSYDKIRGDFYFVVSDKDQPSPTIKPQEPEKVLPKPVAKPEVLTSGEIFERAEQAFEKKKIENNMNNLKKIKDYFQCTSTNTYNSQLESWPPEKYIDEAQDNGFVHKF